MSWTTVRIGCQVDASFYKTGTPGSVTVFLSRDNCEPGSYDGFTEAKVGERAHVNVRIPTKIKGKAKLMAWWHVERKILHEKQIEGDAKWAQTYRAFAAHSICTIDAVNQSGDWFNLYDIDAIQVGRIRLLVTEVPADTVQLLPGDDDTTLSYSQVSAITDKLSTAFDRKFKSQESNIDYLPPHTFSKIKLTVGQVPMWSFMGTPNDDARTQPADDADTECLFLRLLEIAIYSMDLKGFDAVRAQAPSSPMVTEFVAQMITVFTRHMLYVKDSTNHGGDRDVQTDEWMRAGHCRHASGIGYDCEDGTALAYELCLMFRRATFTDERLQWLQAADRGLVPLFCIGSIRLGHGQHTYHAFILKLPLSGSDRAAALYESTSYSTSCWAYDMDRDADALSEKFRLGFISKPIEGNIQMPAPMTISQGVYRHVVAAYSHDGFGTKDNGDVTVRMDFTQDGKVGALVDDVMLLPFSAFAKNGIRLAPSLDVTRKDVATVHKMYACMPRLRRIRCGEIKTPAVVHLNPAPGMGSPRYDICFRHSDWSGELREALWCATRAKLIQATIIKPTHSFEGIRVRIW